MPKWVIENGKWIIGDKWKINDADALCCYRQAYKCSDFSASTYWMSGADAVTLNAFKYSGTCYYFGASAACLPGGATLLTPGDVTEYADCDACNPSGTPCANCSTTTPASKTLTLEDMPECSPGDIDHSPYNLLNMNGAYSVSQLIACQYQQDFHGDFGAWYFDSIDGCTGTASPITDITIVILITPTGITVFVQNATPAQPAETFFAGSIPLTAPYDCTTPRVAANEAENVPGEAIGGTGTLT